MGPIFYLPLHSISALYTNSRGGGLCRGQSAYLKSDFAAIIERRTSEVTAAFTVGVFMTTAELQVEFLPSYNWSLCKNNTRNRKFTCLFVSQNVFRRFIWTH
jgi:hypothetical protein